MRIGFFVDNPAPEMGGGYTFLETIKQEIVSSNSKHEYVIFFRDSFAPAKYNDGTIDYVNLIYRKSSENLFFRLKRKFYRIFFKKSISIITSNDIIQNEGIDLLWILGPYNIDTTIPFVFTVWDLGHRMLPSFPEVSGKEWEPRENLYQKMLPRATYIITGNNTGKKEILANYTVIPGKIHIIPFSIPSFCFSDTNQNAVSSVTVNSPFVFYPAQFWAHKNHTVLIEAIAWLRDAKNIIIYCYFTGHDYGNLSHVYNTIKKYNLDNQIFVLGFIDHETLIYLYKNALAMVYPTYMGPNNLPPLEAAAFGCPLLYSNIPGHLEQMEGVGLPINVTNYVDVGEAILRVYSDSKFRDDLISKELEFAEKYKSYSYFQQVEKIINLFDLYRKTWKE